MEGTYIIKIINRCNQNCVFCADRREIRGLPDISKDELKEKIRKNSTLFNDISLTGGEPTIYEHLPELIAFAKECGYKRIILDTNGIRLQYMEYVKLLVNVGVNSFFVSFQTNEPGTYDKITQAKDSHKHVISCIKNLKILNQEIIINTVVHRLNYKDIPGIVEELAGYKVNFINLAFVNPIAECMNNQMQLSYKETLPYIYKALEIDFDKIGIENFPICVAEKLKDRMSDLRENKTYNNPLKQKPDVCRQCASVNLCDGVWQDYVKIYGTKELRAI